MDINCKNFEECLPIVSNAIEEATFIAIDTEFTGLDDGSHITGLDTPEKRYFKLLKPAKDYLIIQFGLSIFKKMPGHSKYEVKSFNFSIFPRTTKFTPNVTLKFQGPSLEFVTYQGLDFDEVIKKGVSYLSTESERRIRDELSEKHSTVIRESESVEFNEDMTSPPPTPSIIVPHWMKDFVDKQIKHVESAMSARNCQTIKLDSCDLLTKLVLFEQLNSRFPNQLLLEADSSGGSDSIVVTVTFVNDDDHKRRVLMRRHEEEMEELHKVLGFTKVVKLLHESKKLIVGHNMLFDVMHTINQFWSNLPRDYDSFKKLVHQVFPRILDTKHMASVEPFKTMTNNRNLSELYDDLKTNKKIAGFVIEIPEEFPDYMSQSNFHNAAYDAFITGVCFLLMKSYLCNVQKHLTMEEKMGTYENKLYLMRIVDVPYMDLKGDDLPLTTRDHIFHVQFYRNNKKMSDLKNLFAPFGDVDIKFIDDNSAFVCMLNKEKSAIASKKLSSPKDGWYKLQPLSEWYSSRSEGSHPSHGNAVLREGQVKRKFANDDDDDDDCGFGLDVTQENFEESLAVLSEAIEGASFIAVSTEALGFDAKKYSTEFDTPRGRYERLLDPVREHLAVQFGVCTFRKIIGHKKYEAKPFNFSVYPRSSKLTPDVFFTSENSKLEHDSNRGIKVRKIVSEGVTYLSLANERNLCDRLLMKQGNGGSRERQDLNRDNHNSCPSTAVPLSKQEFVDRQIKSVESVKSSRSNDHVTLEPCNSFIRKLLYEQLNFKFPDQLFIETITEDNSAPLIKVTFVDNLEHRKELEMRKQDKKLEELHRALGFTRIVKMIHESKKLIVGHNMLFDVMHTINQFWSNLPRDYKSFKSQACQIFPRLLDTRHMASTEPFKGLVKNGELHKLHEELSALKKTAAPNIQIADDCRRRESRNPDFSNSAFSAYECGVCFLLMKSHLGTLQKNISVDEKISSYENRLHLENIDDVPFINLRGEDLPQSREDMYHFKLKKNRCLASAINILSNQGRFRLLDESSALVRIHDDDKLAAVKKSLSSLKEGSYKLQPFKEWLLRIDQGPHHAQGVSVLRESPPNLKRKHDDDNRTLSKKVPAKRKQRHSTDGVTTPKKSGGVTDPLAMFHFEPKKTEGTQKPLLFEVPDEWD